MMYTPKKKEIALSLSRHFETEKKRFMSLKKELILSSRQPRHCKTCPKFAAEVLQERELWIKLRAIF